MATMEITAIVLAAGAGTRFGGGKLAATLAGRPVLQHVLDAVRAAGVSELVVVVGPDTTDLDAAIDWHGATRVTNPDPARGLSSSVQVGIAALPATAEAALIVLGDQPMLSPGSSGRCSPRRRRPNDPSSSRRYPADGGRNPVLLGRAAFGMVEEVQGDRGLGPVIAAHPELVREVAVDGGNPDVDTRADLWR